MPKFYAVLPTYAIAFLLVQTFLPLSYYLGDDVYDERFAWRMFSSVRMARCTLEAYAHTEQGAQRIQLSKRYHVAWINLAKRARRDVIEGMVTDLCETYADVRMELTCRTPAAARIGVCIDALDRNQDGVPDGYDRKLGCNLDSPSACHESDCGGLSTTDCRKSLCSQSLLVREHNLCHGETF